MTTEPDSTITTDSRSARRGRWCRPYGAVYAGFWLVLIGAIFLLNNFGYLPWNYWGKLWPLFIIVPGVFMIFGHGRRRS